MFTVLAFLNNSEVFEEMIPNGKEGLVRHIRQLQKGYCNLVKGKLGVGATRDVTAVAELAAAVDEQFLTIAAKAEGWVEYCE